MSSIKPLFYWNQIYVCVLLLNRSIDFIKSLKFRSDSGMIYCFNCFLHLTLLKHEVLDQILCDLFIKNVSIA